jgi:ferredoxin-NADP reductase
MNIVLSRQQQHLDQMRPWNDRAQTLECIGVTDEAPEVKTFTFRADDRTWFRYRPGQFVTLELPAAPVPLMRTYTLSSSPSRPFSVAVTVKAQPGSTGTRWMFENLGPGSRIKAYGPAGDFSLHHHPAQKYLFLSAGSGITPMMSMLRWLSDLVPTTDIAFVNCARRPEEIIFRSELSLLTTRMTALTLGLLVEERSGRESWWGPVGRIDATRLALMVPDYREREIFCCGPDPFMRTVRRLLDEAGFDPARYHQESFSAPATEPDVPKAESSLHQESAPAPAETVPIRFALSGVEAAAGAGQTVLQAARSAGIRISAACEFGLCGTCKVKCAGPVEMNHNGGILDHEIGEGFILACCSKPLGPIEIEA